MSNTVFICTESFWANVNGVSELFTEGRTLVSEDSDIYRRFPDKFKPAEAQYRSDVEQATGGPGERRAVKV